MAGTITLGNSTLTADVNATADGSQTLSVMTDDIVVKKAERLNKTVKINGVDFDGSQDITVSDEPTAQEVLDLIKTVDGPNSGLDADLLDGLDSTAFILTSTRGAANGVATLDANSKIPTAQLPNEVFGGLKFVGTFSKLFPNEGFGPLQIAQFITGAQQQGYNISQKLDTLTGLTFPTGYAGIGQTYVGHYWVVSSTGFEVNGTTPLKSIGVMDNVTTENTEWQANVTFDDGVAPNDQGFGFTNTLSLEVGDWIVITGWDNATSTFRLSIVNNTYGDATDTTKGVTQLSNITSVSSATTGAQVITQGVLGGLIGTAANTIAAGNHTHTIANITNLQTSLDAKLNLTGGTMTGALTIDRPMQDGTNAYASPHLILSSTNTTDTTGFVGMVFDTSTSANYGWSYGAQRTSDGNGDLIWRNHDISTAGVERMRLLDNGNLGIGITNPTFKLAIDGGSQTRGVAFFTQSSPTNSLALDATTSTLHKIYTNDAAASLSLGTGSSTNQLYLKNDGNVGIGTTSPSSGVKLEVVGDIKATAGINAEVGRFDRIRLMSDGTEGVTISSPNDIRLWTYKGVSFSASMDTVPEGIAFKSDGTIMYLVGSGSDTIRRYDLSTAWDITTATFIGSSPNVGDATPSDIYLKEDGTKIYLTASTADTIREFNLTTPFDISTLTFVQAFSVVDRENNPTGLFFSDDGLNMYVVGTQFDTVLQYSLSTAWNISTASFTRQFSVGQYSSSPQSIDFDLDGTKMYIVGSTRDHVQRYDLSTGWDISTAVFFGETYVGHEELTPLGIWVENSLNKVFVVGSSTDRVYEYAITANGLVITSDTTYLKGTVEIDESLYIDKQIRVRGAANFDSSISSGGFSTSGTVTFAGATSNLHTYASSASSVVNLGTGATPSTYTKTLNIGTNGANGSRTNFNIGPTAQTSAFNYNIQTSPVYTSLSKDGMSMVKDIDNANILPTLFVKSGINIYTEADNTIFYDSFTTASTINILSHTPDTGTNYTELLKTGSVGIEVRSAGHSGPSTSVSSTGLLVQANGYNAVEDMEISHVAGNIDSSDDTAHLAARIIDENNMYLLRYSASLLNIYRRLNGTWTNLFTGSVFPTNNSIVKFRVVGDYLAVYRDTNLIASVRDNTVKGAGYGGFGFGTFGGLNTGDDHITQWQTDNFTIKTYSKSEVPALVVDGNLGIGTLTPSERLHVVGNSLLDGNLNISGNLTVGGNITVNNVEMISTSNGIIFEGTTNDNFETTLVAVDPTADQTYRLPNKSAGTYTIATTTDLPIVNNGALELQISGTAGATNTTITVETGDGFFANNQSDVTYTQKVGPALTALASTMTGTGTGFLKKTAQDTYTLDTSTYLTSESSLVVNTTGSGNAVTSVTNTGHTISVTKGSTFLTSYTETDTLNSVTSRASGNITTNAITTSAYNMGTSSSTATKATMQYNSTDNSIDFVFTD